MKLPPRPPPKADAPQPLQPVRFHHPDTGEEARGHLQALGMQGASVLDENGKTHRVPHGHYVHDPDGAGEEPDDQKIREAAHRHLTMGPQEPLARDAAAWLLDAEGVEDVGSLRARDFTVKKQAILIPKAKLRIPRDRFPELVELLTLWIRKAEDGSGTVLPNETPEHLRAYAQRFGGQPRQRPGQEEQGGQEPAGGAAPLEKAAASALALPDLGGEAVDAWIDGEYRCALRKSSRGLLTLTISGSTMTLPLHEIVRDKFDARDLAAKLTDDLRKGKGPRRGIYARTAA